MVSQKTFKHTCKQMNHHRMHFIHCWWSSADKVGDCSVLSDLDITKLKLRRELKPVRPYTDNLVGTKAILA